MAWTTGWHVGLLNGWILLMAYFVGLAVNVAFFPKEKRKQLFYEPGPPRGSAGYWILILGQTAAVCFHVLTIFAPLRLGTSLFLAGLGLYVLGYATVMAALLAFRRAPAGQPVQEGPYRRSRNPQWVGLVWVFLGTTLAIGSWLHLGLLAIVTLVYHQRILAEEEACRSYYGQAYEEYQKRVPRYLALWVWPDESD